MITEDELQTAKDVLDKLMDEEAGDAYSALSAARSVLDGYKKYTLEYRRAKKVLDECQVHFKNLEHVTDGYFRFEPGDMILLEFLRRLEEHKSVSEVYVSSEGDIRFRLK